MPSPEMPDKNRGEPEPSNPLNFQPDEGWVSPFSLEKEEGQLSLFGEFTIVFPKPIGWQSIDTPMEETKLLLVSPRSEGTLVIGAGVIPPNSNISNALANIAASPIPALVSHGAQVPVVMSFPTISSIEGVDASHMLNFPAVIPGHLLDMEEETVPSFKHTSVLAIGDKWVSYETTSFGKGCNPSLETNIMSKLHMGLMINKNTVA